jgi:hypothetical protein
MEIKGRHRPSAPDNPEDVMNKFASALIASLVLAGGTLATVAPAYAAGGDDGAHHARHAKKDDGPRHVAHRRAGHL